MNLSDAAKVAYRLMAPGVHPPIYVMMNVTHRCDAKCGHCFFWRELNTSYKSELSAEEIEKLATSIGPTFQVTLTGGSPELRKDLPALARSFHQRCRPPNLTICMNGFHTDRIVRHVEEILSSCPGQRLTIGLSLDGLGEEHNALRGMKGLFDRVVLTFNELAALRARGSNLRLAAAIVVSGLNYQTAEATALWARGNLPIDTLKPILVRGDPKDPGALNGSTRAVYERIRDADNFNLDQEYKRGDSWHRLVVTTKEHVQRKLIAEIHATGVSPVVCSAALENIVIRANGDVMGCELRSEILGNLREFNMDVQALWRSEPAQQFRRVKVQERCACHHHCFLAPAIARTPSEWPTVSAAAVDIWRKAARVESLRS